MYDNSDSFLARAKRTVYKWWCVVYKPVYKLIHHGYWPKEKEPGYQETKETNPSSNETNEEKQCLLAKQMAQQIEANRQNYVDNIVNTTETENTNDIQAKQNAAETADVSDDVLSRANEIMERLAREAAEDEEKKQAEIAEAKRKAEEQERLASIMKANEIDISSFIAEGKAQQKTQQTAQKEAEQN